LKLIGLKPGDEVITVGHTFHATVEAIYWNGATPILVDVGADGQMDVDSAIAAVSERTRAIIPVHLMGDMVDIKRLKDELAKIGRQDIIILEDACQALGSSRNGTFAGASGIGGAFSFYPAKTLGAMGDAGAFTTNDKGLADELRDMRCHYKFNPGKYGFNSRLDNLQAAILNAKLNHLSEMILHRQGVADIYNDGLLDVEDIDLPTMRAGRVYQDYIIRTDKRNELATFLKDHGIETLKNDYHFPDSLPKPPHTVFLESQTLRLPCNDVLEVEEVDYVVNKIHEFYTK
jgi:dTDP-4-amino-4,6-dideoxygalactose transaminase